MIQLLTLDVSDAPEMSKIIAEIQTPGSPHWTMKQLEQELVASRTLAFKELNELKAFVLYRRVADDTFEIIYLACALRFQRQHLMTLLFREFLESVRATGLHPIEIWLEVHEKNHAALLFYEKQGFNSTGKRLNYYQDGGTAQLLSLKIS